MGLDYGLKFDEVLLKQTLQALNPSLHFDMGAALNLYHPKRGPEDFSGLDDADVRDVVKGWQGVFLNGKHLTSMDRGEIPEYNVYRLVTLPSGFKEPGEVLRIGWRTTLENLVRARVPGVTWDALRLALGVDRKELIGPQKELMVG